MPPSWIRQYVVLVLLLLVTCFVALPARAGSISFNFTLAAAGTTSAGAYKTDGTLVRTLWRGVYYTAGTRSYLWDGCDDSGLPVPPGSYQIKVLSHNVSYVWEGVVGNTATNMTGYSMFQGMDPIRGMAFSGSKGYFGQGYVERSYGMYSFATSNPQLPTPYPHTVSGADFFHVATDGTYVYYTVDAPFSSLGSGVVAWNTSTGTEVNFGANGAAMGTSGQETYFASLIDRDTSNTVVPTGLAVQNSGNYLFVSHGAANQIRELNKTSGAPVTNIAITNPGSLAAANDGSLWVICTNASSQRVVRKYTVASGGGLSQVGEITGLSNPLSVAVSPDSATVIVADGGTSQQVKAFGTSGSFASLWTYGQAGGYLTNGPAVTNDKFWFRTDRSFVAFQPDGSFWFFDSGCFRYLHFSAARTYLDKIMFLPRNYVATVDQNNPTRVFGEGWLEFQINYAQPIQQSWTLVNNWAAGLPSNYFYNVSGTGEGIGTVMTMSNGRTYALVANIATSKNAVMELTSGGLRATGTELAKSTTLNTDDSLRTVTKTATVVTFAKQTLNSFDASNNPVWNAASNLANVAYTAGSDPVSTSVLGLAGVRTPVTPSNVIVSFNNRKEDLGWHLGGINPTTNQWLWKASPTGYLDGKGTFDPNVNYGGNVHFNSGRNIIYGYHGEGYRGGQASQWMHFYDDGLFIGQFGTPQYPYKVTQTGQAGNGFNWALVTASNGKTYLYNGAESSGGGIQRWRVDGLSGIAEQTVNVSLTSNGNGTGLTGEYFTNNSLGGLAFTRTDATVNFNWSSSAPDPALPVDLFSVRWAGTIQPLYSETYTFTINSDDGVRLWIGGQQVINGWINGGAIRTGTIALQAGRRYPIVLEYYDNTASAHVSLSWSSTSQASQIVPASQLYPLNQVALNAGPATLPIGNFTPDAFYSTSNVHNQGFAWGTADLTARNAAPELVYQTTREVTNGIGNSLTYTIRNLAPSSPAVVRMHFMEDYWTTPNNRKGTIVINGTTVLSNFDVRNDAGALWKAVVKQFVTTTDSTGKVTVTMTNNSGSPFRICALEVLAQSLYEAESGTLAGGATVISEASASNGQVVGTMSGAGASVTLNNVTRGGSRSVALNIRYAATAAATKSVYVNGVKVGQFSFPSTGSWSTYAEVAVNVTLNSGTNNTVMLKNDTGDAGNVQFDRVTTN